MPAWWSAAAAAAAIAGDSARSARSDTNHSSVAEAPACRNTQRSCDTPAAWAAATLATMTPAARSTCRFAHMSFVYGSLMLRFSGVGVAISSADRAVGSHAYGLSAATSLPRAQRSAMRCWCSSTSSPAAPRSADSMRA